MTCTVFPSRSYHIGGVIDDQVHYKLHAPRVHRLDECFYVCHCAVRWMDISIVRNVVALHNTLISEEVMELWTLPYRLEVIYKLVRI
jgi:hypothetical protein